MTSAPDRQDIISLITEAVDAGVREGVACSELGLHPRTYQRWQGADGGNRPIVTAALGT